MKGAEICDFCEINETYGVYSTDYAPVSLCYCKECLKHNNIRPIEIAIFGWARLGEKYFTPYKLDDGKEYPPMVYCEGKYITVKELIENLTLENINKWVRTPWRLTLVLKKYEEAKGSES